MPSVTSHVGSQKQVKMSPKSINTYLGEINCLTFNCYCDFGIFLSKRKWVLKTNLRPSLDLESHVQMLIFMTEISGEALGENICQGLGEVDR